MKSCNCKKCMAKKQGCNVTVNTVQAVEKNKCEKPVVDCNKYKEMANQKCHQAECAMNKASKVAKEAQCAEARAEELKKQAILECEKANELWDCYKGLSNEAKLLMKEAECFMKKASECYDDLYKDDFGCDIADFGAVEEELDCGCNCNCNCGCKY